MRKQLLLIAGTVLTLASCQNEAANTGDNQAQIDSAVNARVEELRTQMMLQNDSLINAEAQRRADSMIAAMQGNSSAPIQKTTPKAGATTSKPTTKPQPTNPKEDRFSGSGAGNTAQKEARFDDEAAKKAQQENTKKKEERFK
jgi:hypothetical protein